jgi:hypothetical protein
MELVVHCARVEIYILVLAIIDTLTLVFCFDQCGPFECFSEYILPIENTPSLERQSSCAAKCEDLRA